MWDKDLDIPQNHTRYPTFDIHRDDSLEVLIRVDSRYCAKMDLSYLESALLFRCSSKSHRHNKL